MHSSRSSWGFVLMIPSVIRSALHKYRKIWIAWESTCFYIDIDSLIFPHREGIIKGLIRVISCCAVDHFHSTYELLSLLAPEQPLSYWIMIYSLLFKHWTWMYLIWTSDELWQTFLLEIYLQLLQNAVANYWRMQCRKFSYSCQEKFGQILGGRPTFWSTPQWEILDPPLLKVL